MHRFTAEGEQALHVTLLTSTVTTALTVMMTASASGSVSDPHRYQKVVIHYAMQVWEAKGAEEGTCLSLRESYSSGRGTISPTPASTSLLVSDMGGLPGADHR